ncbi:MAG: peptide chain release factor N(5)-glutamine methyltransferase [Pedosphaera sp.]|nr:peptide chain release factor N(5)-glutamine methyltransferase [Pedosphaera sp.]
MTVREAIQRHTARLERVGVPSARLDAEWLLAHVLDVPRLEMGLTPQRPLTAQQAKRFHALAARRARRVPLQHLVGTVSFCGIELAVNRRVLIPRPETELLAELATKFLQQQTGSLRALDFGTGSGCLAIALALTVPATRVDALDISAAALRVARANARRHGVASRIRFCLGDGRRGLPGRADYHLIVSNPPYISSAEIAALQPEVRDHDPRRALDGGNDGLDFYRALATHAHRRMYSQGCLMLEIGDGQAAAVRDLFSGNGWRVRAVHPDLNGTDRIVVATRDDS